MIKLACADVCRYVEQVFRSGRLTPTATPMSAHIATCGLCRAALALLAAEVLKITPPDNGTTCEHCLADLPAFLELAAMHPTAAPGRYPQVWWHLWSCGDCAEVSHLASMLLDEERRDPFSPTSDIWPDPQGGPLPHPLAR